MNHVNQMVRQSKSPGDFAKRYIAYLNKVLDGIEPSSIDSLVALLDAARLRDNTIFVAGNGGSAATAMTMANDLGFDVIKKAGIEQPFRVFALTDNTSALTAIANDVGYENIFMNQLKIHYRPGDIFLAISASGNSPNLVIAADWVKARGGMVISFLGFTGGRLKEISDLIIHISSEAGEYGPVEDAHLVLNHILAHWFQITLK